MEPEEDYCFKCKKGILNVDKCEFCREVYCKECEKVKCAVCTIPFQDEKCPICLDHIDIETAKYFTCHNCASISCSNCISEVEICPCCRDELKTPKIYLIEKFLKIVKVKPNIINNVIGCILCRCGSYKEAKKYFKRSNLKLAKQNLNIIERKNIDYTKFINTGFWYTNLYNINNNFAFILNKVEFPKKNSKHLAELYYSLKEYEKFINVISTINFEKNGYIQCKLGNCYYFGYAVKEDRILAAKLLIKSVENGCYEDACGLGNFYMKGSYGLDVDYDKAEYYYLLHLEIKKIKICPHCKYKNYKKLNLTKLFKLTERENIENGLIYNVIGCHLISSGVRKRGIECLKISNTSLSRKNLKFVSQKKGDYKIRFGTDGYNTDLLCVKQEHIISFLEKHKYNLDKKLMLQCVKNLFEKDEVKLCLKICKQYEEDNNFLIYLLVCELHDFGTVKERDIELTKERGKEIASKTDETSFLKSSRLFYFVTRRI